MLSFNGAGSGNSREGMLGKIRPLSFVLGRVATLQVQVIEALGTGVFEQ